MAVPYTFGSATTSIPLSQLDSNFATGITLGNTSIQLGNTVTTLNNMTLANVSISSSPNSNVTIGNTTVAIGSSTSNIGNLTLANVTITSGNVIATSGNVSAAIPNGTVTQVMFATNVAGNGPAFSAYPSANQTSISNVTNTKITLDLKEYDTNTCFNNSNVTVTLNGISTPSYSFAPNVAGYYQVSIGVAIPVTTNNYGVFGLLYKNGTVYRYGSTGFSNSGMYAQSSNSYLVYLNGSSDYVSSYVYGSVGGSFNLDKLYVYFSAAMVRSG
jgi:hypothetical protein